MLFKQTNVWPKVHSSVTKSTQEAAEEACSGITLVCGLLPLAFCYTLGVEPENISESLKRLRLPVSALSLPLNQD